jgi:hypothetical protein
MRSPTRAIALASFLLSGCASGIGADQPTYGIVVADDRNVLSCQLLGDVSGVSPLYGLFVASALKDARDAAFREAKKMGATHLVWVSQNTPYGSTSVTGKAYRCSA